MRPIPPTTEIHLQKEEEQPGSIDAEIALLSEQRAMHVVRRYQTLSVNMSANADVQSAKVPEVLLPVAPPVSLYANLVPLARLSVQLRALLRVTLYRRLAELSFRGVDFCQLPREVMKDICHDMTSTIFAVKWPID